VDSNAEEQAAVNAIEAESEKDKAEAEAQRAEAEAKRAEEAEAALIALKEKLKAQGIDPEAF